MSNESIDKTGDSASEVSGPSDRLSDRVEYYRTHVEEVSKEDNVKENSERIAECYNHSLLKDEELFQCVRDKSTIYGVVEKLSPSYFEEVIRDPDTLVLIVPDEKGELVGFIIIRRFDDRSMDRAGLSSLLQTEFGTMTELHLRVGHFDELLAAVNGGRLFSFVEVHSKASAALPILMGEAIRRMEEQINSGKPHLTMKVLETMDLVHRYEKNGIKQEEKLTHPTGNSGALRICKNAELTTIGDAVQS